ncbi:acyl-CoA dehydrogenase family protein [Sporichthya sp.]|uniref:acyl-CoA dehydrogenase family protein n=1 Tax=Sporichthya sp. TaxID=65475 RepID=UPI0017BA9E28|nr:acyl-CoA dehydrogenase family protein [Sporichthya sp.]MBA3743231.1 acyl-CoA dehydrogenase family protein [Sporichthya sp.]
MDLALTAAQLDLQARGAKVGAQWREHVTRWDLEDKAPYDEVAASIVEAGLIGLTMPAVYGGADLSVLDYVLVVEQLIKCSQSWIVAETTFGTTGPGPSIILRAEHEATRAKFLPDIVAGRKACAIALTEPDHGSDLTALTTSAVDDGDAWVINGRKRFITGSPVNELYATFVRFDDIPGHRGIGVVVIEKDTPGLRLEPGAQFVGTRGLPHGEMHMDNCRVPKVNVVRGPGHFGDIMSAFNMERIHNSTLSLALAEAAYDEAVSYIEKREAFGKPIIQFQSAYHTLVDLRMAIEAHRMLVYRAAATAVDGKFPLAQESSMAKLSGCLMLPEVTLQAMILCGGDGTTMDFAAQRLHRDSMAALVAGGSPPVLKNAIASQLFPQHRFVQ